MKLMLIEFDDELREHLQEVFNRHQVRTYKTLSDAKSDKSLSELDYVIIDIDREPELLDCFIAKVKNHSPASFMIAISCKSETENQNSSIFNQLLIKPNLTYLLDLANSK